MVPQGSDLKYKIKNLFLEKNPRGFYRGSDEGLCRTLGIGKNELDQAVGEGGIYVLPGREGLIYYTPDSDPGLKLLKDVGIKYRLLESILLGENFNPNKVVRELYVLESSGIIKTDGYLYDIVGPVKKILEEIYRINPAENSLEPNTNVEEVELDKQEERVLGFYAEKLEAKPFYVVDYREMGERLHLGIENLKEFSKSLHDKGIVKYRLGILVGSKKIREYSNFCKLIDTPKGWDSYPQDYIILRELSTIFSENKGNPLGEKELVNGLYKKLGLREQYVLDALNILCKNGYLGKGGNYIALTDKSVKALGSKETPAYGPKDEKGAGSRPSPNNKGIIPEAGPQVEQEKIVAVKQKPKMKRVKKQRPELEVGDKEKETLRQLYITVAGDGILTGGRKKLSSTLGIPYDNLPLYLQALKNEGYIEMMRPGGMNYDLKITESGKELVQEMIDPKTEAQTKQVPATKTLSKYGKTSGWYLDYFENIIKPKMIEENLDISTAPKNTWMIEHHFSSFLNYAPKCLGPEKTLNDVWEELGLIVRKRGKRGEGTHKRKYVPLQYEIGIFKLIKEKNGRVTQEEIADNLGLGRSTVSEIFTLLEGQGRIRRKGNGRYEVIKSN